MDPVSHVIVGRTIVAALENPDRTRFGTGAGVAAILGALSPDVDCVLMPAGWDIYLKYHEVGTHSLAGSILAGCAVAAAVRACTRGSRYTQLAAAAGLGAVSHLALDVISGARLGLAWPVSAWRVTWPLVAMAEPWLIAVLTLGAAALWIGRRDLPRTARLVLLAVAICLGVRAALFEHVRRIAERELRSSGTAPQAIEAGWGSWTKWNVFERDPQGLRTWEVDGWSGRRDLLLSWPIGPEPPLVTESRSLGTVGNFLSVHALGFAVEQDDADGRGVVGRVVRWSDIRYCRQLAVATTIPDCGLWFGGSFDAAGRPLMQQVEVGGWLQTRPVSR